MIYLSVFTLIIELFLVLFTFFNRMESEEHGYIDILIRLGGGFKPKKFKNKELIVYDGGWYYWKKKAKSS